MNRRLTRAGRHVLRGLLLVAGIALLLVQSASAGILQDFSLVVIENVQSSPEVEGRTIIGGNLTGSFNAGSNTSIPANQLSLIVGGSINANVNLNKGSLQYGGAQSGNLNNNSGGTITNAPFNIAPVKAELEAGSAYFQSLTANNSVSIPGSPGPVNFNVTTLAPGNVAVFALSGPALFGNGNVQQMDINLNGAQQVIINVSGTSINWGAGGNFVGNFVTNNVRARVLWNFYEATSITLNKNFNGALLAPYAHLTNSTSIDGSVGVKSMTLNGEVHQPTSLVPLPEPSTLVLAAGAFLAVLCRRVGRKAQRARS